jgi:hypothetical protein
VCGRDEERKKMEEKEKGRGNRVLEQGRGCCVRQGRRERRKRKENGKEELLCGERRGREEKKKKERNKKESVRVWGTKE